MKKEHVFFVCIMLISILILSCSKDSTGPNTFPDDPLDWLSFSYIMEIGVSNDKGVSIEVLTQDSLTTGELTINGYTAPLEISGWFFFWIYTPVFDSSFTPLNPGDSITYTLRVNEKTYSGEMILTYQPEVAWPDTFDAAQDFTLHWNIQDEPDIYYCECEVDYQNNESEDHSWTFKGPRDEYTIAKKYYNDDEIDFVWIALASYNYYNYGSCFVYSIGMEDENYHSRKTHTHREDRMMKFKRIKMLLMNIK